MKKLVVFAFCTIVAAFALVGCGKQNTASAGAKAPGSNFVVGFDADFKPYGYIENGEYVGFDLDLAREVCKRNQWVFKAKPIAWEAKDMELNSGSIDCIWNGFTIDGRESLYEWSLPYVDNSQVVLVLKNSDIKTFADLAGKTVAAQTDTPVLKALSPKGDKEALGSTFKKIVVTPNYNNAVMELEAGSVDAVALDIGVAKDKLTSGKFRMLDEIVISEKYGVGFKLGNKALRDAVQNTLIEMVEDGTAAKISAKYFDGKDVLILKRPVAEKIKADVKAAAAEVKADVKAAAEKTEAGAKAAAAEVKADAKAVAAEVKADAKAVAAEVKADAKSVTEKFKSELKAPEAK